MSEEEKEKKDKHHNKKMAYRSVRFGFGVLL